MICESDAWRIFKFYNSTSLSQRVGGVNFVFVIDIVKQVSYLRVEHCYSGEQCVVHWPLIYLFAL